MLSHSMEAATQMNGCEFGAEWDSTSEVSSFPALFSCNSTNSQQKDSWNIGECWRTHDGSTLPAGGHGRGPFMSACCLTQLTRPQGRDPQPAGTSSPEVAMTRHVNSLCDPEARLSGCSTIDSQYCFSSFLNSLADSENLQAENFIYSANVRKDIDGIRIYPRQPHELQAYLGTVYPSCDVPPAGSMSAAVPPCISLEQSQGFVCNSADIFPSAVRAPEDVLSSTDTQAQAFIADIIHSTTLASASISRGGFPRGDATGSHDNLYSLSNPLAAHNQITNNGQTGETIDRQNRIKEINSGTVIPPTNSSISGDPSAKLTRCKDNLVGQYCSRNQPQRLMNIEVHTPCKRISTDAVGENPPPAKKSALWNSTNQDSPVMGYKSSIPPAKAALMGSSALNTNLRQRTKQGSASDPQSIAARHRRERISERLKILQDLVPNGSKVDLVTMLEKAINYVKFLQLQVKVLTTDEYWPIQDKTSSKIMRVEDALQAIASADAELGHACANNMDCTSATDQTLRV